MARTLTIEPVLNGFIVKASCQTLVFNSITDLCDELEKYYKNPSEREAWFLKHKINDTVKPESDNPFGNQTCCDQQARSIAPLQDAISNLSMSLKSH